jgi:trehalose synthase
MDPLQRVVISTLSPERFKEALPAERYEAFAGAVERARQVLYGRVVFNINSTGRGGGVAEMLRSLLAYARGEGIDARWLVIPGNPDFFHITKRLHNHLHGMPGDGGELGQAEADIYRTTSQMSAEELTGIVKKEDVVFVHDPQPAALIPALKEIGATVIWRCHIGLDRPDELAQHAWGFLKPYVEPADAYVFSRHSFVWWGLDQFKIHIVPPSIDAFSPKNQALTPGIVDSILSHTGLVDVETDEAPVFLREDGTPGRVDRQARMVEESRVPGSAPIVVQVSRWDRLKDPVGVIEGFARYVAPKSDAHLILAGPDVEAVADDPEGVQVLGECSAVWMGLPEETRKKVHLASLPMDDGEENAAIVNALQRRADVVVQKSLAEGFGLTVAEAMWKARPVVATRIGGIQDQVVHGKTGLLVDDPEDLEAYGEAVLSLIEDPDRAEKMGKVAQERVRDIFLGTRHLMQYLDLIEKLLQD